MLNVTPGSDAEVLDQVPEDALDVSPGIPAHGNSNSGGNGTNGTPADDAIGGPITGLIPRDLGNAPIGIGDGGFRPANNPHWG